MIPAISIDLILHIDQYLNILIQNYGVLTYLVLFFIIFIETGFVVFPFLPGDSLLFIVGALAAVGSLNLFIVIPILIVAAISGDSVNYYLGYKIGRRAFTDKIRFLKKSYINDSEKFYEKHGGKTIFIARFLPFIRTFAPFVAGIGKMDYKKFLGYNVSGAIVWVSAFILAGFFFGNIPIIKDNMGIVLLAMIVGTIILVAFEFIKSYFKK
ncbi:MAG: VTT domain-containing protein [Candidatus Aenigmarchaeota archaeon]|nr:VTT domain-containing protein [Candidatus Aenigmarchaeota archaeon]